MSMNGVLTTFPDNSFLSGPGAAVAIVDVGKMWQALSAMTTPHDDPLASIAAPSPLDPLRGGTAFGEDGGYGPARYLTPDEVRAVHDHLTSLTDDEIKGRFDADAFTMAGIYPMVWDEDPEDIWVHELLPYLTAMRKLYADAATSGHWAVLEIR